MRKAILLLSGLAVVLTLLLGLLRERRVAFGLGVAPDGVVAALAPGAEACQGPIDVPATFDAVRLSVAGGPGRIEVRVGNRTAAAEVPAGSTTTLVRVRPVAEGVRTAVCVRDLGPRQLGILGARGLASRSTSATLEGRALPNDLSISFERSRPRSLLALLPAMISRAALFRGGWIGPWLYWPLLLSVVAGVPMLLALAARSAGKEFDPGGEDPSNTAPFGPLKR